jgi:hypothetical protein
MQYAGDALEDDGDLALAGGAREAGVFVKGLLKFIITDDLIVAPASTSLMLSLFQKFGVRDPETIEETILQLSSEKVFAISRSSRTLISPLY